jgi:cell wall-associated NlpC family hydrolase
MAAPNVPFYRPHYPKSHPKGPTKGQDVIAIKRAISRENPDAFPWQPFDPHYNKRLAQAVANFQRRKKIDPATGFYGKLTHEALRKSRRKTNTDEWAFDAYGVKLYNESRERAKPDYRTMVVQFCIAAYNHRDQISYSQTRPIRNFETQIEGPWRSIIWDCSGFATVAYRQAGLPDPNGFGYNGWGYTGTLVQYGRRISVTELKPGDMVFYGSPATPGGSAHVGIYIGGGKIISHGSWRGPLVTSLWYRSDLHSCRSYIS